jgi:hypothetical protein
MHSAEHSGTWQMLFDWMGFAARALAVGTATAVALAGLAVLLAAQVPA